MNIYEKMQKAKLEILKANLKKSGENRFAGFKYYELADIVPTIIQKCNELKLFTSISFSNEYAILEVVNIEEPSEKLSYGSPMKDLQLKGCNEIQALGGVETYQRRYLYMTAFDIIENDMFDAVESESVDSKISINIENALRKAIIDHNKSDEEVVKALKELGHDKLNELRTSEIGKFRKILEVD